MIEKGLSNNYVQIASVRSHTPHGVYICLAPVAQPILDLKSFHTWATCSGDGADLWSFGHCVCLETNSYCDLYLPLLAASPVLQIVLQLAQTTSSI